MEKATSLDSLERLNRWYRDNCNGDWEHQNGVVIETIDNPGWSIRVDLFETPKENQEFESIETNITSETEWLSLKKSNTKLVGACAPSKLLELLNLVTDWLEV